MDDKEAIDAYVDGGLGISSAAISIIHPTLSIAALAGLNRGLFVHLACLIDVFSIFSKV